MPVTMSPDAIVPALWTTTYIQAPLNGQGNYYYNIPSAYTAKGTVSSGTVTCDLSTSNIFSTTVAGNITFAFTPPVLSLNTTVLNFYTRNNGTTIYGGYAFADLTI